MNRTEAPSRPLLPRDEGDTNVLDDDTQSASHSPRPSTPLAKPKNVSESTAVKKTRLAAFFASVAAVFVAVPRYFTTGCKRCGHAFAGIARRRWTSETFSLLFASLSLLGLVATLVAHQGKPLPQWPQLITINSIISLFSILIRAGVSVVLAEGISQSKWQWYRVARKLHDMERFDAASRGAWGSILLLLHLKIKRPYIIAALGALASVVAAFTGFGMQQLIRFDECLLADQNATVHIQRTNVFGALGRRFGPLQFDIFPPMASAMNVGIIQPVEDLTSVLSHGCTTGNCTFPSLEDETFSTLAITHSCENVTSQVQTHTLRENETWTVDTWTVEAGPIIAMNGTEVGNYILGLPLGENDIPLSFAMKNWPGVLRMGVPSREWANPTVKMIIRPNYTEDAFEKYTAVSCSIYPAVNTYSARIWNGVLTEELVRSIRFEPDFMPPAHPEFGPVMKLGTASTIRDGSQQMCKPQESAAPGYVSIAQGNIVTTAGQIVGFGAVNDSRVWYLPQDCVWQYQLESFIGFEAYLSQLFDGQWLGDTIKFFEGSIHLRQLYQEGNITMDTVDEVFGNMTRSMTNVIRTYGVTNYSGIPDAGPARGTMWFTSTCVHVRWSWLAFPAAMIGMSGIFLVLVLIESRGTETERLWKSSVLALLFCEMDSEVVDKAHPIRKSTLNEVAKSTSVSFGKDRKVLKLSVR